MAKATAAPVLLSLLKELKGEAEASLQYSSAMTKYCKETKTQKISMVQVLKRQLDEAAIATAQVDSEEARLSAEEHLANHTAQEKQMQLLTAAATSNFAHEEFDHEQRQIQKTVDATSRTIRFIQMQKAQKEGGSVDGGEEGQAYSFVQRRADTELVQASLGESHRSVFNSYATDLASTPIGRTEELLQMLVQLRTRLEQEKNAEISEHTAMVRKIDTFTDHLNSSILETQTQAASIRMEAAQRKRVRAGWDGKVADATTMLAALKASSETLGKACSDDAKRRHELAAHISNELSTATALLRRMPSSSSYLLFGDDRDSSEGAPSFLQLTATTEESMTAVKRALSDLGSFAHQYPEEADLYSEGIRSLAEKVPKSVLKLAKGHSSVSDGSNQALLNIAKFVTDQHAVEKEALEAEGSDLLSAAKQANNGAQQTLISHDIKGLYGRILKDLHTKEFEVSQERQHCTNILRDADVDSVAIERSLKRIAAKLHIAQASVSEHQQISAFNQEQKVLIQQKVTTLAQIAEKQDAEHMHFVEALRGHSEQLLSLVTDLEPADQEATDPQEHGIAGAVRELAQKVEAHEATMQQHQRQFTEQKKAVDNAEKLLLSLLSANGLHNERRMTGVKAEVQLLTSLAKAKEDDRRLGQEYQNLADELCSEDTVDKLIAKAKQLKHEAQVLKTSSIAQAASTA
jgi:hypothetical protein